MSGGISRRGLLTSGLTAAAAGALGVSGPKRQLRRSLRVAFITDIHLDAHETCIRGFADCLKQIHALDDPPDLIIQGGDLIMDALVRDEGNVGRQYSAARHVLDGYCRIPIEHVIGNHDIWGWQNPNAAGITSDPRYGKNWWLEWTGYRSTYRSFDRNGWHFIILDSIMQHGRGYSAKLDVAQLRWLQQDLERTPDTTPVCLISHIPILSAAAPFFGPCERTGNWTIHRSIMHIDARVLKDLMVRHPQVRACLSGHVHMAGRVEYNNVKHLGFGAVSGAWWRGKMQETPPQFGIVDFYANGHVHSTLISC